MYKASTNRVLKSSRSQLNTKKIRRGCQAEDLPNVTMENIRSIQVVTTTCSKLLLTTIKATE